MTGNWARYETIRGKGAAAKCMLCGKKPVILEKEYCDGSHSFSICCPGCYQKHFKDKRETGISITVVAENVYNAIRDWNKVNALDGKIWRRSSPMNERTDPDSIRKKAEEIKQYCIDTGCLYCQFRIGEGCRIRYPRNWRVKEC